METVFFIGGQELPFLAIDREALPCDRLYVLISVYAKLGHILVEAPEDIFA